MPPDYDDFGYDQMLREREYKHIQITQEAKLRAKEIYAKQDSWTQPIKSFAEEATIAGFGKMLGAYDECDMSLTEKPKKVKPQIPNNKLKLNRKTHHYETTC